MILPTNAQCRQVIKDLDNEPNLTEWEYNFLQNNLRRSEFTDLQKEVIHKMMEKYDID